MHLLPHLDFTTMFLFLCVFGVLLLSSYKDNIRTSHYLCQSAYSCSRTALDEPCVRTVIWESFIVKIFSKTKTAMKIKRTKIQQLIIKTTTIIQDTTQCEPFNDFDSKLLQAKGWSSRPRGSLSSCLPSQAIALADKEVEKVTSDKGKQRGQYRQSYSQCEAIVPHRRKTSEHTLANLRGS